MNLLPSLQHDDHWRKEDRLSKAFWACQDHPSWWDESSCILPSSYHTPPFLRHKLSDKATS